MTAMSRLPALAAAALSGRVYEPAGYPALRDRIAGKLTTDGRVTAAEEVIVTNGATQALSLLAGVLTRRGDTVLVEELTCPTVLASLRTAGLRLVVVPIEREGADPQAVEAAVRRYEPSFIYVIPTYHNPTGWTMTERRRAALASIARRYGSRWWRTSPSPTPGSTARSRHPRSPRTPPARRSTRSAASARSAGRACGSAG